MERVWRLLLSYAMEPAAAPPRADALRVRLVGAGALLFPLANALSLLTEIRDPDVPRFSLFVHVGDAQQCRIHALVRATFILALIVALICLLLTERGGQYSCARWSARV